MATDGLKIEVNKVPAADREAAMAAVGAGEGDFTLSQPELSMQAEQPGRVVVTFVTTKEAPNEWAGRVATASDYPEYGVAHATWGTVQGLLVPAVVDDTHVAWLYACSARPPRRDLPEARRDTGRHQPGTVD